MLLFSLMIVFIKGRHRQLGCVFEQWFMMVDEVNEIRVGATIKTIYGTASDNS